jgi:hypothetical protein
MFYSGHPCAESFNFRQIFALKSKKLKMGTAQSSVRRRPWNDVTDKGVERFLPTSVQKSYFMLSNAERLSSTVLSENIGRGSPNPFFVGGKNLLKPALRLMTSYRLAIQEIKDSQTRRSRRFPLPAPVANTYGVFMTRSERGISEYCINRPAC